MEIRKNIHSAKWSLKYPDLGHFTSFIPTRMVKKCSKTYTERTCIDPVQLKRSFVLMTVVKTTVLGFPQSSLDFVFSATPGFS